MDKNLGFGVKDFEYFDYINKHRKNLMICFNLLWQEHNYATTNNYGYTWFEQMNLLKNRILEHDLSKFNPIEFYAYRQKFYKEDKEIKEILVDISFDEAWKHHYIKNSHHPDYHDFFKTQMTELDIMEMVLDWSAMSLEFGGSPLEYYKKNKEEKLKNRYRPKTLTFDFDRLEQMLRCMDSALKTHRERVKKGCENTFSWM